MTLDSRLSSLDDRWMLARIVSLVLIAAIIACPIWCGNGLCHAGRCCSTKQSPSGPTCAIRSAAFCCCDKRSPSGDRPHPAESPCKASCQGVCGGAIFEKPCLLSTGIDAFYLTTVVTPVSDMRQMAKCRRHGGDQLLCISGDHGRSLRILHMSLLC